MNLTIKKSLLAIAVSGVLVSPVANATNGYFSHGYSTKEKGLAGAGAAYSQDAMAAATNPAGMVLVGDRLDVGLAIFSPSPRKYTSTGPASNAVGPNPGQFTFGIGDGGQSIESENDFFLIPHLAYNKMLSDDSSVGLSIYGNGGMNTEYKGGFASINDALVGGTGAGAAQLPGTFGAGTAGVNLEQLFFNVSFAKKLNAKHSVGASVILAAQRFRAQGLEFFGGFSSDPSNISGNRNSYSYGAGLKFGYQGEVADGFRVGVSYQSKVSMSEFDEYKGLFAEGGDFDIPSTYTIGISYDVGNSGIIVADYQRIMYTDVAAISNPISRLTDGSCNPTTSPASGAGCLGGANGAGFGWQDIGVVKIGYQFDAANTTWRVGYSRADQPIPDSETMFNILAPGVVRNQLTAGLTKKIGTDQEFNLSLGYALNESVEGQNPFDPAQTIKIEMSQIDVQAGWAWKF
jgi:long-chain fatty acid transport protein